MTSWQNDAAMIYFMLPVRRRLRQFGAFDERTAACRAPVCFGLFGQNGATLAADAFHDHQITGRSGLERNCAGGADASTLEACTHRFALWRLTWTARCCRPFR